MYEYRCEDCGRKYEQLRRMSEADQDLHCPQCGSEKVKRQFSACAIGGSTAGASGGGACGGGRGFT